MSGRAVVARWSAAVALLAPLSLLTVATQLETGDSRGVALTGYVAAIVGFGVIALLVGRGRLAIDNKTVWIVAILARLMMLGTEPVFSDDVYRYLWDGHVQLSGINPYVHAPLADTLAPLRTPTWSLINHPEVPTIYPPLAQLIFAFVAATGSGLTGMRIVMVAAELAAAAGAITIARRRGHVGQAGSVIGLLVLWNPLCIVEFASSAHLDALAIASLVWALALLTPRVQTDQTRHCPEGLGRWAAAGALIGVSVAAKLIGAVALLPLALWALAPRGLSEQRPLSSRLTPAAARLGVASAAMAAIVVVTSIPYLTTVAFDEAGGPASSLSTYARHWRWNDGLFAAAYEVQHAILEEGRGSDYIWSFDRAAPVFEAVGMTHEHEGRQVASTSFDVREMSATTVKLLAAVCLGLVLLTLLASLATPETTVTFMIAGAFLLSPVVHPWYVAWLVLLGVATNYRAMLLWGALVVVAYLPWLEQHPWLVVFEYVPVVVLLGVELWRHGEPCFLARHGSANP